MSLPADEAPCERNDGSLLHLASSPSALLLKGSVPPNPQQTNRLVVIT
jgi:hypothetical protein